MSSEAASIEAFGETSLPGLLKEESNPMAQALAELEENALTRRMGRALISNGMPLLAGIGLVWALWAFASFISKDLTGPVETIQKNSNPG